MINILGLDRVPLPTVINRTNESGCENYNITKESFEQMFVLFKDCPDDSKNYYLLFFTIFIIIRDKFGCEGGSPDRVYRWFYEKLKKSKENFIVSKQKIFRDLENYNEETFKLICDLFEEFCTKFYLKVDESENDFTIYNIEYNIHKKPNCILGVVYSYTRHIYNGIYRINDEKIVDSNDTNKEYNFDRLERSGTSVKISSPSSLKDRLFTGVYTLESKSEDLEEINNNISIHEIIKYVLNSGNYITISTHITPFLI
jgi:hypothetical protein